MRERDGSDYQKHQQHSAQASGTTRVQAIENGHSQPRQKPISLGRCDTMEVGEVACQDESHSLMVWIRLMVRRMCRQLQLLLRRTRCSLASALLTSKTCAYCWRLTRPSAAEHSPAEAAHVHRRCYCGPTGSSNGPATAPGAPIATPSLRLIFPSLLHRDIGKAFPSRKRPPSSLSPAGPSRGHRPATSQLSARAIRSVALLVARNTTSAERTRRP